MKKRVLIDYKNIPEKLKEELKIKYPDGYNNFLISFFGNNKQLISALPYETEDVYYMIKVQVKIDSGEDDSPSDSSDEELSEKQSLDGIEDESFLVQEETEDEFE